MLQTAPLNVGMICKGTGTAGAMLDVQPNNSSATLLRVHYMRKDNTYKVRTLAHTAFP